MLGRKAFILVLIFCITACLKAGQMEEMNLTVLQQGTITAVGGELKYISLNISVPPDTDYQIVTSNKPVRTVDGRNTIAEIESRNPSNPFPYSITSSVKVNTRRTFTLPQTYQLGYLQMRYTQPSARVQSDDAEIRKLARDITVNSSDDFERVAKLGIWVSQQISYDLSLAGELKDSKWILENKRGVCTEYSTIFIALARSIGIPARFVTGLAYDDDNSKWEGHSWAEVYIGNWVPVDATWNEVGYLDARHLEISDTLDDEDFEHVYTETSQSAHVDWSKLGITTTSAIGMQVTINGLKETQRNSNFQLDSAADTIGFGVKTLVFATVTSDDYRVANITLTPCTGDSLTVEDEEKQVIFRPGESKVVSWVVRSNQKLLSNYIYTCPLIINSNYLSPETVKIQMESDAQSINFNAFVEKSEIKLGQNETVNIDVGVARKYEGTLYLTQDDYLTYQPLVRSGRYSFTLQSKRIGLNTLYVATSWGGVKELQFKVSEPGGIGFDVDFPKLVALGSEAKVRVNLTSNVTINNIRITASAGTSKQATQITLTGNKTIEFPFNITDENIQNITVTVESSSYFNEIVKPITVYKIPQPNLSNIHFFVENDSLRVNLLFSGLEGVDNATVTIDDHPVPFMSNGTVSVLLNSGMHVVKVSYSDATGAMHVYTKLIDLPLISELQANQSKLDLYIKEALAVLPAVAYFSSLIFLTLLVIILRTVEKR